MTEWLRIKKDHEKDTFGMLKQARNAQKSTKCAQNFLDKNKAIIYNSFYKFVYFDGFCAAI